MTNLETITGNLRDAYAQIKPGTMLHSHQLTKARVTDAELRTMGFYTADGEIYTVQGEEKTPLWSITREPHNLVLRHLSDKVNSSYEQLVQNGNFIADPQEGLDALKAENTLTVDLTQLSLQRENDEFSFLPISTTKYGKLTPTQRKVAERVYGQDEDFVVAMNMFKDAKIKETRIWVLNPSYVQGRAQQKPICRASWLGNFYGDSDFDANGRYIFNDLRLRGVRREVIDPSVLAAGDAAKNRGVPPAPSVPREINLASHYDALLADQKGAVAALNDTRVAGLTRIVANYLASKAQ